jgi:hypothetical protein
MTETQPESVCWTSCFQNAILISYRAVMSVFALPTSPRFEILYDSVTPQRDDLDHLFCLRKSSISLFYAVPSLLLCGFART